MRETETRLWNAAFVEQANDSATRLSFAYRDIKERAGLLAGRIAQDLPDFTVHDISHCEGVWETADLLAPKDFLNPAETFVFGAAILIHDLGLAAAAYPDGLSEIQSDLTWREELAFVLRQQNGLAPSEQELLSASVSDKRRATASYLRRRHAERGESLARVSWSNGSETLFLIDEPWRSSYGDIIGRIAASHGWTAAALETEFATVKGAAVDVDATWTVDPLRIAALLRCSDAAHIDARRAKRFARALQNPALASQPYWDFQARLNRPDLRDGSLTFTSSSPFGAEHASAWWLCAEALEMIDRELKHSNQFLRVGARPQLLANGVRGAGNPALLATTVEVAGWTPVDAGVSVSDLPGLIDRLGGRALYGENRRAPIRELIQNAGDAVRARRRLEKRADDWGSVHVELTRPDGVDFELSVTDNGVGMTDDVLAGELLDFGTSLWSSRRILDELPGLVTTPFASTGRFGIGFFAAFLLGKQVKVASRSFRAGPQDTRILEFVGGLASKPLLRPANEDEQLLDPGTRVSVAVAGDINTALGFRYDETLDDFHHLISAIAPATDVSISVGDPSGKTTLVVAANDWKTVAGDKLARRLTVGGHDDDDLDIDWGTATGRQSRGFYDLAVRQHMRPLLSSSGETVGRLALTGLGRRYRGGAGAMVVGGLSANPLEDGYAGVLFGEPSRAARDTARAIASPEALAQWATDQASLIEATDAVPRIKHECARYVAAHRGDLRSLPIALLGDMWLSLEELIEVDLPDQLVLTDFFAISEVGTTRIELSPGVLITGMMAPSLGAYTDWEDREISYSLHDEQESQDRYVNGFGPVDNHSLATTVLSAIAKRWGCEPRELRISEPDDGLVIGMDASGPLRVIEGFLLGRPE